ncbi:MAG: hypothetical protein HN855_06855 [Anaerolineae bacterium]|jgi:hypothetical protein|nr:hypothetical protein [Anaerolineae bacterium]MBT7071111.1 hypothetical protein [Anaerolineae bacterium]MBT7324857.1 hypothetical protein [Anaerolineae bacterium]
MPRIRCLYMDCNFLDDSYCTAPSVEIDPDLGCATYVPLGEVLDDEWDDDEGYDAWETEDISKSDGDDDDDDEEDW